MKVKVYVEGGGDTPVLKTECRKGFSAFIKQAGILKMPSIVACGGRQNAYESYCLAISKGDNAFLLIDSEVEINEAHQNGDSDKWLPWAHLKARVGDNWDKPAKALDIECHLMAQVMESWFIADGSTLKKFFGAGFKEAKLPTETIESVEKSKIYKSLKDATILCKSKGEYGKGPHSFKILADIDPKKVQSASPWAKRFIEELKKKMGS